MAGPLYQLLKRRAGSTQRALNALSDAALRLGIPEAVSTKEQLAGLALCARGENLDSVSRYLSWRDFEGFCSGILRAKGYRVRENVYLRKPRAQVDVLAYSDNIALAVDCKHWARAPGYGALVGLVDAQKSRARRLHGVLDDPGPIAAVILVVVDGGARFVSGGAVVPIFALGDFLDNVEAIREFLDFV